MNKWFLIMLYISLSIFNGNTNEPITISDVRLESGFYRIYYSNGSKGKVLSASYAGEFYGFGKDFILFSNNGFYTTYDENFNVIKRFPLNTGDFRSVSFSTINFVKNNFITTYDKNFNKLSTKPLVK